LDFGISSKTALLLGGCIAAVGAMGVADAGIFDDSWITEEVEQGTALPDLYPPDAKNLARHKRATEIAT